MATVIKDSAELERKIRSRPGAAERIDAQTDAMRAALRLADIRKLRETTQTELAKVMHVTQENVSRIETADRNGGNIYLSTLQGYVDALGGRLEVNVVFDDDVIPLGLIEAPANP